MVTGPVGLWVDWDGDGFGTGAYDDLTALVTHASYSRGSAPEITGAAQAGQAVFTVKNPNALFNPDNDLGPLVGLLHDGPPVWWGMREDGTISGTSDAAVRGRFAGRVVEVVPLPQAGAGDSTPLAQIICEDPLALYGRIPVALSDDCSPPIPPIPPLEQYGTQWGLSEVNFTWPIAAPGAGNLLIAAIQQRAQSAFDSSIAPFSENSPKGTPGQLPVAGTTYTFIDGFNISIDGGDANANPISMFWRDSTVDDTLWLDWKGLAGTSRPRAYQVEIAGLSGAPSVVATSANVHCVRTDTVYPLATITVGAAGYIWAIMGYSCTGVESRGRMLFTPRIGKSLLQGYNFDDFGPFSWFGYYYAPAAGTYTIILDRTMGAPGYPRNGDRYGSLLGFWAGPESPGYPA